MRDKLIGHKRNFYCEENLPKYVVNPPIPETSKVCIDKLDRVGSDNLRGPFLPFFYDSMENTSSLLSDMDHKKEQKSLGLFNVHKIAKMEKEMNVSLGYFT